MAAPKWFDYSTYMQNKLVQMQALDPQYTQLDLNNAFSNAGFTGAEGAYKHFVQYGKAENVSPNDFFDVEFYYQSKAKQYFGLDDIHDVSSAQVEAMKIAFKKVGLSAWDHYLKYGMQEGIDPNSNFNTTQYMNDKLDLMKASDASYTMDQLYQAFKDNNLNPVQHYVSYGVNEGLSAKHVTSDGKVSALTENIDELSGTQTISASDADDVFSISIDDQYDDIFTAEVGTLQSEDKIDGLGGNDLLEARVNASASAGSLEPTIWNVETVLFRSQIGSGAERTSEAPVSAYIDADRIDLDNATDNLTLGSDNSRAHLKIEDVRHNSNVTTIRFADADPAVDFRVYFDPQHLKSDAAKQSGALDVELMDVFSADTANGSGLPLMTNPYNEFRFYYTPNGGSATLVDLDFLEEDVALYTGSASYDDLVTAFNHALQAQHSDLVGVLTIKKGDPFTARAYSDTDGILYEGKGNYVLITASNGSVTCPNDGVAGWRTDKSVPPDSNYDTRVNSHVDTDCPLIKVNVELDNVGRVQWDDASPNCLPDDILKGSQAGDLEIGSMSMRSGVERMDVKVDQGSWLQSLYSTNNTLRMVTVEADDINGDGHVGNVTALANGNEVGQLYIGSWENPSWVGSSNGDSWAGSQDNASWSGKFDLNGNNPNNATWTDRAQLLTAAQLSDETTGVYSGLKDVAVFDATSKANSEDYAGDINIAAAITVDSYDKYFKFVDGMKYITSKNAPTAAYNGKFSYLTGTGDDTVNMSVHGDIASDVDFGLNISTGAGEDLVAFRFDDLKGSQEYNQKYMKNVTVDTGADSDTVWFYGAETQSGYSSSVQDYVPYINNLGGALVINTGAGNDVVYANQIDFFTGGQTQLGYASLDPYHYNAVWLFNNGNGSGSNSSTANQIAVNGFDGATLNNDAETGLSSFAVVADANTVSCNAIYAVVSFKGILAEAKIADYQVTVSTVGTTTTYSTSPVSAEQVNHGIINAINSENSALKDLLVAKDASGHALMVESLINGKMDVSDLAITFELRAGSTVVYSGDSVFKTTATNSQWYASEFATGEYEYTYEDEDGSEVVATATANYDGSGYDNVASSLTSQVIVNTGANNDTIVLGPQGDKDIINLEGSFGDDTILGFDSGVDKIAIKGIGLGNGTIASAGASALRADSFAVYSKSAGDDGVFSSAEIANLISNQEINFASRTATDAGQLAVVFLRDTSGNSDGLNYTALLVTNNGTGTPTAEIKGTLTFANDTFDDAEVDFLASLVGVDGTLVDPTPAA